MVSFSLWKRAHLPCALITRAAMRNTKILCNLCEIEEFEKNKKRIFSWPNSSAVHPVFTMETKKYKLNAIKQSSFMFVQLQFKRL